MICSFILWKDNSIYNLNNIYNINNLKGENKSRHSLKGNIKSGKEIKSCNGENKGRKNSRKQSHRTST